MGHRDRVDPSKMAIEGSATFANGENGASSAAADVTGMVMNSSIEETLKRGRPRLRVDFIPQGYCLSLPSAS